MRPEACRRSSFMCRLNARRSELVARGHNRNHGAAMAMLAPDHRLFGGVGGIIRLRREGLPSCLGATERTIALSQVDEPDRQKCQSGNDRDHAAKRRSEKIARNSHGFGHPGK